MRPLVIYHADCIDGFGAAFAAWLKFGNEADYLPMQYNSTETFPDVTGRDAYILDFSFPRVDMDGILAKANRVVWLDHHKTAFEMWVGEYQKGMQISGYDFNDNPFICLDDNRSGALLAWEHFHPEKVTPKLIQHIDDRDRWQWKLEGSAEVHAALSSYTPWTFQLWEDLTGIGERHSRGFENRCLDNLIGEGKPILRLQKQHIARVARQARKCNIISDEPLVPGGSVPKFSCKGLTVNSPLFQSEIGNVLATESGTYGLVWYVSKDNRVRCSIRSNGAYDVSEIARSLGGGGHLNASGFEIDLLTLMNWLHQ